METRRGDRHVHVYVSLERDADGYPPFDVEEVDAVDRGDGRFRIDAAPVFVYGLAPGDVVRAAEMAGDDRLWVVEVVEFSQNWCWMSFEMGKTALNRGTSILVYPPGN